jgi:hypothetical protein
MSQIASIISYGEKILTTLYSESKITLLTKDT